MSILLFDLFLKANCQQFVVISVTDRCERFTWSRAIFWFPPLEASGERQKLLLRPVSAKFAPIDMKHFDKRGNRCYIAENALLTISKGRVKD